ncbi:MAG: radical SAM protein [Candidatus Omnitrophica bacterium]|nr:radical SAM protein [Candidatus Omnitrophota bacterium]
MKPYKVLFINPPLDNIVKMEMSSEVIEEMGHYPPLGLMYLATYLKEKSRYPVGVKILDCAPEKYGYRELRAIVSEWMPDMVAVTTFTPTIVDDILTARLVKEINPAVKTILGGHHVDSYPLETLRLPEVDYVSKGEGEESLLALVEAVIERREPAGIPGIGYKKDGKFFVDDRTPFIADLDTVPIPDRGLIRQELYTCTLGAERQVATVMSSRGCPFQCTFCYSPTKNYRMRSIASIMKELEDIKARGIQEIFFFDDLFNVTPQRTADIARAMLEGGLTFSWSFRGRVSAITDDMLKVAKKAGLERIHYGIETSSDDRLKTINKHTTVDMIEKAVKLTRANGIIAVGSFMIGLPGETRGEINRTFAFMRRLKLDYVQIAVLMPYPHTKLYGDALSRGIIKNDYWKEFADNPLEASTTFKPQVWTEKLSQEELFGLVNVGYKGFYMRPSYILASLLKTRSPKELFSKAHAGITLLKEIVKGS